MKDFYLFVGTYTRTEGHVDGKAEGIYTYRMDAETGELTYLYTTKNLVNPSYITIHPNKQFLYAVNELSRDNDAQLGTINAYAIHPTTKALTFLNTQRIEPNAPCHISVDPRGNYALVANYKTGTVAVLPILANGHLGKPTDTIQHIGNGPHPRQLSPHAHFADFSPDGKFVTAVDLGIDKVMLYELDPKNGKLNAAEHPSVSVTAGAGSRHLNFHPNGKWVYVINELNSTIEAFTFDKDNAKMERFQIISSLPEGYTGEGNCAAIHVHPNGKFLYGSNRKDHHSIGVFSIDAQTGRLQLVEHESTQGHSPRDFTIAPNGKFLLAANQDTDAIITFEIDDKTGALTPNGRVASVKTPACLKFLEE